MSAGTNFFQRQREARAASRRLVVLFGVAVAGIVLAICGVFLLAMSFTGPSHQRQPASTADLIASHWAMLLTVAVVTLAIIAVTSAVRAAQLRQGGGVIARQLGGTPVPPDSRDLRHQRLRNVVEEMAIASGVPVPEIYVLEGEPGINAFAAGFSTSDAAVAVTRGALEQLNRDELQGVIAHEFSHVLNGDMRLNLRLIGWLAGITLLGILGRLLMRVRGRNAGGVVMLGVAVVIIGAIGTFCARLIKAGISRRREYLADASAVQFTRQSRGIAGALKKIAGTAHGSRLGAADGEEVSHLLFGDGVGYSRLFATHPPLVQRIAALEPGFTQADLAPWLQRQSQADTAPAATADSRSAASSTPGNLDFGVPLPGLSGGALPAAVIIASLPASSASVQPRQVVDQVAEPDSEDYLTAGLLHRHLPEALVDAAHDPDRAAHLLLGLLVSTGPETDAGQTALLGSELGVDEVTAVAAYRQACTQLHPMQRLPLAQIAFAALRRLPQERVKSLSALVDRLIHADSRVSLFEYCLGFLMRQQINEALEPSARAPRQRLRLDAVAEELTLLLSLLARAGHADAAEARFAFAAGVNELGSGVALSYRVAEDWPDRLDAALLRLDRLKPAGKELLVAAMTRAVMHDGLLEVAESELLRTACAALHCPLPPLLHEADAQIARQDQAP
ncbi:MAG: M48 family metallopeptidase [Xanthomonadales bacterium]|nr:M48 family metallopeptidase [Xanthomonadales bacterium]